MKNPVYVAILLTLISTNPASAQSYQPPALPNHDVDSFNIDLKSGRYVSSSPVIVNIGDNNSSLAISFVTSSRNATYSSEYDGQVTFPSTYIIEVRYGNSAETFSGSPANDKVATVDYFPQIESGSILRRTYANSTYFYTLALKDGKKYYFEGRSSANSGSILNKISFPYGKQINITPHSVSNNFGFQIQRLLSEDSGVVTWRGVNRAIDICSISSSVPCPVTALRQAKTYNSFIPGSSTDDRTFENAVGEKTVYRYKGFPCINGANSYCLVDLPTAIDLPGGTVDEIKIEYNYPNVATRNEDDIMVTKVTKGTDSAKYSYIKSVIPTGGYASRGYNLTTSVLAGGIVKYKAESITPPYSASSKARTATQMLSYTAGDADLVTFYPDAVGRIIGFKQSDGRQVKYQVDTRNNYTKAISGGADLPDLIYQTEYPATCSFDSINTCNLPSKITDPRGNIINLKYNSYGQVIERTVSDAKALIKSKSMISYQLQFAKIKSEDGSLIAAGQGVSMVDEIVECNSTVSCSTDDRVTTKYIYQDANKANNIFLIGTSVTAKNADGVSESRLTCYVSDYFGQEVEESLPKAERTSC